MFPVSSTTEGRGVSCYKEMMCSAKRNRLRLERLINARTLWQRRGRWPSSNCVLLDLDLSAFSMPCPVVTVCFAKTFRLAAWPHHAGCEWCALFLLYSHWVFNWSFHCEVTSTWVCMNHVSRVVFTFITCILFFSVFKFYLERNP